MATSSLQKIKDMYAKYYNDFSKAETSKASAQKLSNEESANNSLKQAYINSELGKKSLLNGLTRQGITGGATETSLLNANNNYNNITSGIRNNLASNNAKVSTNLQNTTSAYKLSNDQNLESALQAERERQRVASESAYNKKIAAQNLNEKRFVNTISLYTSEAAIKKAIKKANKKASSRWKTPYLWAQLAKVRKGKG